MRLVEFPSACQPAYLPSPAPVRAPHRVHTICIPHALDALHPVHCIHAALARRHARMSTEHAQSIRRSAHVAEAAQQEEQEQQKELHPPRDCRCSCCSTLSLSLSLYRHSRRAHMSSLTSLLKVFFAADFYIVLYTTHDLHRSMAYIVCRL